MRPSCFYLPTPGSKIQHRGRGILQPPLLSFPCIVPGECPRYKTTTFLRTASYFIGGCATVNKTPSVRDVCTRPSTVVLILQIPRLTTLFNTIPRQSGLRLLVHQSIVSLSGSNGELEHLQLTRSEVDKWVSEWNITSEERSQYLKSLVDAYANAGLSYVFDRMTRKTLLLTPRVFLQDNVIRVPTFLRPLNPSFIPLSTNSRFGNHRFCSPSTDHLRL